MTHRQGRSTEVLLPNGLTAVTIRTSPTGQGKWLQEIRDAQLCICCSLTEQELAPANQLVAAAQVIEPGVAGAPGMVAGMTRDLAMALHRRMAEVLTEAYAQEFARVVIR